MTTPAVRDRFRTWAPVYEEDPFSQVLVRLQRVALNELQASSDDQVLDLACGSGHAVRQLMRRRVRVVGVDSSPAMLARARELGGDSQLSPRCLLATAERLPIRSRTITAVLCTTAWRHFANPEQVAAELARVLIPGGRFVIGDFFDKPPCRHGLSFANRHPERPTLSLLADHGLVASLVAVQASGIGQYHIISGRRAR